MCSIVKRLSVSPAKKNQNVRLIPTYNVRLNQRKFIYSARLNLRKVIEMESYANIECGTIPAARIKS